MVGGDGQEERSPLIDPAELDYAVYRREIQRPYDEHPLFEERLDIPESDLEQHPKIMRNVQRARNRRAALPSLTGIGPPASSALPRAPCPRLLFSYDFWVLPFRTIL